MDHAPEQLEGAPPAANGEDPEVRCLRCETGHLAPHLARTALWRGEALMVIRDVPTMICASCGEEYVDDRTALALDRIRGQTPAEGQVSERMIVPVITYSEPKGWRA